VINETTSKPLPGATLLGRVPAAAPGGTLYARTGDLFGWLCTVAALLLALAYRKAAPAGGFYPKSASSTIR
jgi:apolipoprotein N-acyltransferase